VLRWSRPAANRTVISTLRARCHFYLAPTVALIKKGRILDVTEINTGGDCVPATSESGQGAKRDATFAHTGSTDTVQARSISDFPLCHGPFHSILNLFERLSASTDTACKVTQSVTGA
jgi:hypothetical protein